jgi:H+/Cl- antiporter ClcA
MSLVIGSGLLVAFLATWINHDILGSGKDLMNQVLFTEQKTSSFSGVAMRILGPIIAFNTGAAGGVFAPSLAAGASIGTLISDLAHLSDANANILILSGMVGFLTGVTRTPFTSAILVLEMTDRHSVIFHLMLAAMISNFAALLISKHSFYEELKKNYITESTTEPLSRSRLNL